MKEILANFNKAFESRVRLGIMSVLAVNDSMDFTGLRETLAVTDGNLASHLRALEEAGYINMEKSFINRKPNTSYSITEEGLDSFSSHLKALEELIRNR
ncbi:MAG: transcriptional regulator [Bacteroidales bacterium]|jgi:DNA-binding MarR family transcriptional regulator|nr:transcriptional regulator [Bacteroidales bacterium]MDD3736888.1 transcriptional regulator [Bacteroidales bacterium]NLD64563.1 transcriptional regulator [Bacteroidales bacterium]HOO67002.1 transcriptional regulator [Bacteroidales bacterium]HPE21796.1 transcriptional regulator [Bacteroidales bacterium]